jgi:hypothetical protein
MQLGGMTDAEQQQRAEMEWTEHYKALAMQARRKIEAIFQEYGHAVK